MKNLEGNELKEKFLKCLDLVEKNKADINEVYFIFSNSDKIIDRLHFSYNYGYWNFRNVSFLYSENNRLCHNNDIVKKIIVQNMYYDVFSYINFDHIVGKVECCGHGDFWRTDIFCFNFFRFNVDKD